MRGTSGQSKGQRGRQESVGTLHPVKDVEGDLKDIIIDLMSILEGYFEGRAPFRETVEFVAMLKKHPHLWRNTDAE